MNARGLLPLVALSLLAAAPRAARASFVDYVSPAKVPSADTRRTIASVVEQLGGCPEPLPPARPPLPLPVPEALTPSPRDVPPEKRGERGDPGDDGSR